MEKIKVYGNIPHLSGVGSRISEGDKKVSDGQTRVCVSKTRDKYDKVYVQEKLDGACVGVLRASKTELRFLTRSGFDASESPFAHHRLFAQWGGQKREEFFSTLEVGEMMAGEWMTMAHGIRYEKLGEPFYAFDIIDVNRRRANCAADGRVSFEELQDRLQASDFGMPNTRHEPLDEPVDPRDLHAEWLKKDYFRRFTGHPTGEGFVYRVERKGRVDFLAKWVHPDIVPGELLFAADAPHYNLVWNGSTHKEMKVISDFYA